MDEIIQTTFADRMYTRAKIAQLDTLGTPVIENTNLQKEGTPLGQREVEIARNLIQTIVPVDIANFRVHAHLQLTAKFARQITESLLKKDPQKYKDLSPNQIEILALFHDIGRFITHRFYRTDLVGTSLLKVMGIREDLMDNTPSIRHYFHSPLDPKRPEDVQKAEDELSIEQKILQMADICGKRIINDEGAMIGILTFEQVMEYHRDSRKKFDDIKRMTLWPSERQIDEKLIALTEQIYRKTKTWLKDHGVDVEDIRSQILKDEEESIVQAVIFDVGGVIIPKPNNSLLHRNLEEAFNADSATVKKLFDELLPKLQKGVISEDRFWELFSEKLGNPMPTKTNNLLMGDLSATVNADVKAIINKLKKKFTLAILTDTIPLHSRYLEEHGVYSDFSPIITSPEIGVTKQSPSAATISALRLSLVPQACILVDDKSDNVEVSKAAGMKGVVFTSAQQLEQDFIRLELLN